MKRIILIGLSFMAYNLQAQVGINTETPKATLDVKGDARIQELKKTSLGDNEIEEALRTYDDCPCFLVIGNDGKVRRLSMSEVNLSEGEGDSTGNQGGSGETKTVADLGNSASATIEDQIIYISSITYTGGEHQGVIDNDVNKYIIKIPYTNGDGGAYQTATSEAKTVGVSSENGASSDISMKITGGTLTNGTGFIEAEIATPSTFNVKKLEATNTQKIADFKFTLNGQEHTVSLTAIGGILDKQYGDGVHNFVYLPIQVTDNNVYEKVWLNYNLGAAYSKLNTSDFNLGINKTGTEAHNDDKLYGSLYQWQRQSDGHEFRNSETIETQATDWTATSPEDVQGKFIVTSNFNWVTGGVSASSGDDVELWQSGGENNPCPKGFHVPTKAEWIAFHKAVTGTETRYDGNKMQQQQLLSNLPMAGQRVSDSNSLENMEEFGIYWGSESAGLGKSGVRLFFKSNVSAISANKRADGLSVRCVKD
ncbi:fibrobacter succinogenes major paralogous domain-containing protein [Weeksellaceae bacterium TAE3-ERU29]|nr:fibrobacter succinogenes major paralogous domain-containing protein [Weeksellaceae bacterium TAE3-ERU29]